MLKVRLKDGAELAIREFGQGKQPVVLLHGLGMDSSQWLAPLWPYRKHYRFILPDFRGAGLSRQVHIAQQDVFQSHAEDILEVINTLQLDQFLLVGYSLGGSTALHLNHLGKWDGVKAYLHIDQSPAVHNRADWAYGMMGPNQATLFDQMHAVLTITRRFPTISTLSQLPLAERKAAMAILSEIFATILGKPWIGSLLRALVYTPSALAKAFSLNHIGDLTRYLNSYLAGKYDYLPALHGCQTPVTCMIGMHSPLYDARGQRAIAETVTHGSVIEMAGSGHAPMLDQPIVFSRELGRWLRESA